MDEASTKKRLRDIPNVGPSVATDLYMLGIREVADLVDRRPEDMYRKLEEITGKRQDPCVLDTFMSAVHFAKTGERRTWWSFTPERKSTYKEKTLD